MLIPSIDLFNGQAVQWRQGKEPVLARDDVRELLAEFSLYGEVALIDLNAATGQGDNQELIYQLLEQHSCRVGGGIRSLSTAQNYLKAGASKIILGTACQEPWVAQLPKSTLIFALDAWGEDWLSHGWQQKTGQSIDQVLAKLSNQCSGLLYTQVQREGMLQGIDRQRVTDLVQATRLPVTVAGGVTTTEDVVFLQNLGAHAQIGMALYTGKLSLAESFIACVNFNKSEQGLIPTVVQDRLTKEVLMLAYSTADSLRAALTQGQGIYYSRSRQEIWHKGKTSGHYQTLCHVDLDCDADTLLFQVEQQGAACHLERWSCFPSQTRGFNLATLDRLLAQRQQQLPTGSYTARLLQDSHLNIAKLREETEELIDAKEHPEVRWEAADVLYFTLVLARARGVSLQQIEQELRSRQA